MIIGLVWQAVRAALLSKVNIDQHPELVDEVLAQTEAIEAQGLQRWARKDGGGVEPAFQTLMTGLGIRYFRAVAGDAK